MRPSATVAMPVWAKVVPIVLMAAAGAWWIADRHDRLANQERLGAIASGIAEREVRVSCPGPVGRMFGWDTAAGSVAFDAAGRPGEVAKLRAMPCAELDALAEGRRPDARTTGLARAVATLTHEAWHLYGERDEAITECRAIQTMAPAARRLGATEAQAHALAVLHYEVNFPLAPEAYRTGECRDGGRLDLRPSDPRWP
jgi:hypothetical protein